jgi:ClpX C4-type zinc finger protein
MTDHDEQPPSAPPPAVACERVLQYALLDDSVGFHSGHGLVSSVKGHEVGRVACLVICTEKRSSKFLLQFCDSEWTPEAVAAKDSVDEAKRLAERIYPRSSSRWVEAHFSEDDANRYLDEMFEGQRCSFCNKRPDEVPQIFGNGGPTNICSECIEEFHAQL